MSRTLIALASLSLLATACGGGDGGGGGCSINYSGDGVSETLACEATVRKTSGGATYQLWVMAVRGSSAESALLMVFDPRPEEGIDYSFDGASVGAGVVRVLATHGDGAAAHAATTDLDQGALELRFTTVPASDPADPSGLDGIGTVHGAWTATLPSDSGTGGTVTASGTF